MSRIRWLLLLSLVCACVSAPAFAGAPWLALPPIPTLPKPDKTGVAHVNGIDLWYAEYGSGSPVILLHGGLAQITARQLQGISVPTWIVDGDHDELIKRENIDYQFRHIPRALELIVPGTSHFAFLQKPKVMNAALLRFMAWQPHK